MSNFTLGRYVPMDSPIHCMDPRAKIMAMLVLLVCIFIPAGWAGYALMFVVACSAILIAKLSFKFIWKSMKPMLFMLVFLFAINIFSIQSGSVWLKIGSFELHSQAVFQTLYIAVRLLLMIMITTCLTATTKPLDMTLGIEDLLKPFEKIHVPSHMIAMLISIALRFIPDLIEETQRIMKAQESRGVDLKEGKLKEKVMAILALIVPLFVSAFQRAEDLAEAMEARGFVPGRMRTRYKQLHFTKVDYVLLVFVHILLLVLMGIAIWL
ncbi:MULTISPECIES: energy-coupling factor transporter transmembrane protein EcfT [Terrabacteria group]|uniref:energy-coupling factor transporter transmembrane component T family protein n=1 Tax=Bacillati TaxID=1783272 RepID=UPI001C6F4D9D|nr:MULTISPECIES: energy-coupling factor transporter transmembrane component T [Terrabacteria group]MBW9212640.1 energy-coupling factor transporter transmembrane protein EcfT [Trueperella sp. zg.1013]